MMTKWKELREKVVGLQSDLDYFKVGFLDRNSFREFCNNFGSEMVFENICITGYFSETIRDSLEKMAKRMPSVRLICPELSETPRDKKNLEALKKLVSAGAQIKVNNRLHARFLVTYNISHGAPFGGLLVIGSFDFNTECIGMERYDAGIRTRHPDLINSAIALFEQIWNEQESQTLEDFIKKREMK